MGQGLGISPVVVFISLFVWGWLLGGIGAILAVPLTLLIIAVLESSKNTRVLATLMRLTPDDEQGEQDNQPNGKEKLAQYWAKFKADF